MPPVTRWMTGADAAAWREQMTAFPRDVRDLYFEPEYACLYETADTMAGCFVYQDGGDAYQLPLMWKRIERAAGFADLSTPYGYGGPMATTDDPQFIDAAQRAFCEEASERKAVAMVVKFHP